MKKIYFTFGLLLVGALARADLSISGNAFLIDTNMRLFEVCGTVTGGPAAGLAVDITVDPKYDIAHYVTMTSADGHFCQVLRCVTGEIDVSVGTGAPQKISLRAN